MKKDFLIPIAVLTGICFVIAAALAVTNRVTEPVIAAAAAERAMAARREILPDALEFEPMPLDGAPASVKEAYRATNHAGYVFMLTAKGYSGDIDMICGISEAGKVISARVLQQTETKGLGTQIADAAFGDQFAGKDAALRDVSAITGATISSTAYINAIKDAFTAFELMREGSGNE